MDEGSCVYFGPWTPHAAELLSRYLPTSHLLAAAGQAEQPRDDAKKPGTKKAAKKEDKVSGGPAQGGRRWQYVLRWQLNMGPGMAQTSVEECQLEHLASRFLVASSPHSCPWSGPQRPPCSLPTARPSSAPRPSR